MHVLFTGLNGLIGSCLASLVGHKYLHSAMRISSFVRSASYSNHTISSRSISDDVYFGSCASIQQLAFAVSRSKPDLIIHIAQHRYTSNLIKALCNSGHNCSLLIVGTTAVFSKFPSCSLPYLQGEQLLLESGLDFCLIRPTMIYGSSLDKNIHKLYERIDSGKLVFLPNNGASKFQPVFYKDIGYALFSLLDRWMHCPSFEHRFINLPGPDTLSLREICTLIATSSANSRLRTIPLSLDIAHFAAKASYAVLQKKSPILPEQILRLQEDKVFSSNWEFISPSFTPTSFADGVKSMIESYLG
jgi:hypothetical protein